MTVDKFGHHITKRQKLDIENAISLNVQSQDVKSKFEELRGNIAEDIKTRFEKFSKEVYDRVTQEVKYFKTTHETIHTNAKLIEKKLNGHLLIHQRDSERFKEVPGKILSLENKVNELSGKLSSLQEVTAKVNVDSTINLKIDQINSEIEKLKRSVKNGDEKLDFKELSGKIISLESKVNELSGKLSSAEEANAKVNVDSMINLKIDQINSDIEELKRSVKNGDEKLDADIKNIHTIMGTNIREIMYLNHQTKIEELKKSIEHVMETSNEILNKLIKGRKSPDIPLGERRTINELRQATHSVNETLNGELNKIKEGLANSDSRTTVYFRTTLKDSLDNLTGEISKINEYLSRQESTKVLISRLKNYVENYKSYFDSH